MIHNVEEFVRLVEYDFTLSRGIHAESPVWREILEKKPELKMAVALNKKLPDDILETLAHDTDNDIRFTIAMKRGLSPKLFDLLSKDKSESVRMRIAHNPKTPRFVLESLTLDSWDEIALVAKQRLDKWDQ